MRQPCKPEKNPSLLSLLHPELRHQHAHVWKEILSGRVCAPQKYGNIEPQCRDPELTGEVGKTSTQARQRNRKTDAFVGCLENEECCGLSGFQRTQQLVVNFDLGKAAA